MDKETVKKVAEIARLHLEDGEIEELTKDLENILGHFSRIRDLKAEKEMYYVHEIENEYRTDEAKDVDEAKSEKIRGQFTKAEGKYLVAPKSK